MMRHESTRLRSVAAGVTLALLTLNPSLAARAPTADAACDALDLKWDSNKASASEREIDFYLFDAADLGCVDSLLAFIDAGATVQARDRAGNTAFLLAARKGNDDVLDTLLDAGSNAKQVNLIGSSALLMAVVHNRRKTVTRLLELGVDVNLANTKSMTPLIAAAYNGNSRILDALLVAGADPGARDDSGKGALVYAVGRGYAGIAQRLLDSENIDINARYGNELTALMWAAGHANDVPTPDGVQSVVQLLEQGADIDLQDNRGRTALHIAAERGHAAIVELLLDAGADNGQRDTEGLLPVDLASSEPIRSLLVD